jgi:hypothetical protein
MKRAQREVDEALTLAELLEQADPTMRRITAKALARADQLARKVDALGDNLLAETARGTSVHPFVGHEREARNEFRLHWQALVKDALERRGKKPKAATAPILTALGPPARRLEAVS